MVDIAWFLTDLLDLIYQLAWLVFLTQKHYNQATTTAGHIFELYVLLINTIGLFLWVIFLDSGALDGWCTISNMISLIWIYNLIAAITISQIETAIFLKTLNVNTMMTNTAGEIILATSIFTSSMVVIITLVHPSKNVCQLQSKTTFCESVVNLVADMYRIIPCTLSLVVIFAVLGFSIFRSYHIKRKKSNDVECPENFGVEEAEAGERRRDASQGELFTVQRTMSELNRELDENQETHAANVEDDIVVEDIELVSIETLTQNSSEQVSFGMMIHEIGETNTEDIFNDKTENEEIQCFPAVGLMMKTLNKYLKNTLMSLLILSFQLPWYSTFLYGFITNSGCEDPTFWWMMEIIQYLNAVFDIFLPLLIKLKLDRLSQ